ncbi:MAG: hypothetical protein ACYC99_06005 [Candidatus Geothermincolia bacterium]
MDNCKFCGNPGATVRRHAVPTWFLDEVQVDPKVIRSYEIHDITGLRAGHFHFPDVVERSHENVTDYLICEQCAGGWIEELNVAAREPMGRLLRADVTDIGHVQELEGFLKENSELLVKSAFEVVLACDFLVESATIPDKQYMDLCQGRIPQGVFVELGFCKDPSHFRIMSGPIESKPSDMAACTYRVAFQAGKMVMMVRHVKGVPYDPYPGNIILHPEFVVGEALSTFDNAIEILAWDIIAMEYFNEKARAHENTFLGIYEEDPRSENRFYMNHSWEKPLE